jgi:hypothetical protein
VLYIIIRKELSLSIRTRKLCFVLLVANVVGMQTLNEETSVFPPVLTEVMKLEREER